MEMSEAWPDIYDERYIHEFEPEPTHKQQQKHWVERYLTMEHLLNDHKGNPNQFENSLKLCDKMGHPVLKLLESQWKLRQQHDQNFPMERKPL